MKKHNEKQELRIIFEILKARININPIQQEREQGQNALRVLEDLLINPPEKET
jgi:hypothetical protein